MRKLTGICCLAIVVWLVVVGGSLCAQKFSGTGGVIPIDGKPASFTIKVAGLPTAIDANFGLEQVGVNIVHTWDNDLSIYLVAPDGTVTDIARKNGEGEDNYTNTYFRDDADVSVNDALPPFGGQLRPEVPLGGNNNGQNPNGAWKLVLIDTYPMEENGRLLSWSITFGKKAAKPYVFPGATLPLVILSTQGQPIVDEPKCNVNMRIIDNGPGQSNHITDPKAAFEGLVAIELRGRSSQLPPKLSYGFQTLDSAGKGTDAVKLLDLPKDKDFVLTANYADKSLMRNHIAYSLFEEMGHYAPRTRLVDLVIDGSYRGVYLLGEKIKRGKDRVDISRLDKDDNAGDSLTGGYIIKTDWTEGSNNGGWTSKYLPIRGVDLQEYKFHAPEPDQMTEPQKQYIQSFVDSFEVAIDSGWTDTLRGYGHYIDVASFVDMYIMVELGKNVDGYWRSSYYYKDKTSKGGKLHAGPIWDYDLAFGNFEYYQGYYPAGWHWETYSKTSEHIPMFWNFLAQDPQFQDRLKCRWTELRKTVLSNVHINAMVDAAAAKIGESQRYNFEVWPILGKYIWTNAEPYEDDYAGEVRRLKEWFVMRCAWMDAFMPGQCK